jgi:hypothetical protein
VCAVRALRLLLRHLPRLGGAVASVFVPANARVLARNARSLKQGGRPWADYLERGHARGLTVDVLLERALAWMCHSQDRVGSGGVGCYEFAAWTAGYPEVTGYIIPTFWDCAHTLGRDDLARRAVRMAEWELRIQDPSGGWEGGYEGDGRGPVVFNTGQVIRGLVRAHEETGDEQYLDAAARAGHWIVEMQEPDGSWAKANFKGMRRVYDAYVAAPLVRLAEAGGGEELRAAARRSCEFVLRHQHPNGWFECCDNSPYFDEAPLTHTICYTIDGLLETGGLLGEERYVEAARTAAAALLPRVERWSRLYGRLDPDWNPAARWVCLTGAAQLGIIFMRLHAQSRDGRYLAAARKLLDFLAWVQELNAEGVDRAGAIAGAYPIWGFYCPLKYPSWATKYFVDLLLAVRAEVGDAAPVSAPLAG